MLVPLDHRVEAVAFARQHLAVSLMDGRTVTAPLEWFPLLAAATPRLRDQFTIDGDGRTIIWPTIGEAITTDYLLARRI